jgi:hypothetical protein
MRALPAFRAIDRVCCIYDRVPEQREVTSEQRMESLGFQHLHRDKAKLNIAQGATTVCGEG